MSLRIVIAFAFLLLAACAAEGATRLVVMPMDDVAASGEAEAIVSEFLAKRIAARGWEMVPQAETESVLERRRVRYVESLDRETLAAFSSDLDAEAVLTVTILGFREKPLPFVALSARLISVDSEVRWGNVVALSGGETESILGIGRHESVRGLTAKVLGELLSSLPQPRKHGRVQKGDRRPLGLDGPRTFRSELHRRGDVKRICILPFSTRQPEITRMLMALLTIRLESSGEFHVVEQADFRAAMRKAGFRYIEGLTSEELAKVGEHLDTTLFLRGNVHAYRDSGSRSEIQLDLTLSDVASGSILWAATHQRRGDEYAGLFLRGAVQNGVLLADRVISEAVRAQKSARTKRSGRSSEPRPATTAMTSSKKGN